MTDHRTLHAIGRSCLWLYSFARQSARRREAGTKSNSKPATERPPISSRAHTFTHIQPRHRRWNGMNRQISSCVRTCLENQTFLRRDNEIENRMRSVSLSLGDAGRRAWESRIGKEEARGETGLAAGSRSLGRSSCSDCHTSGAMILFRCNSFIKVSCCLVRVGGSLSGSDRCTCV